MKMLNQIIENYVLPAELKLEARSKQARTVLEEDKV